MEFSESDEYRRVTGYRILGRVGDLKILYVGVGSRKAARKILVVGYLNNLEFPDHIGEGIDRSELYALAKQCLRMYLAASLQQAKVWIGTKRLAWARRIRH